MARFFRRGLVVLAFVSFGSLAAVKTPITEPVGRGAVGAISTQVTISKSFPVTVGASGGTRIPITINMTRGYGMPTVRQGIKALMTRNPVSAAGSLAIGGALGAVGYLLDPATMQISKQSLIDPTPPYPGGVGYSEWVCGAGRDLVMSAAWGEVPLTTGFTHGSCSVTSPGRGECEVIHPLGYVSSKQSCNLVSGRCPDGMQSTSSGCKVPNLAPLDPGDLDQFVNTFDDPSSIVSDVPLIIDNVPGSFDYPDTYDISGPASVDGPPTTTTSTNHTTGDVTTTHSQPTHSFEYQWDPTSNIAPSVITTTTTQTDTYVNGQPTSSTTTSDAGPNPLTDPINSGSGGGGGQTTIEVPTDCDFMPTVCKFIEWVKTPFNPEEPDFSQFIEDNDFTQEVNFSGNATCPPPIVISTSRGNFEFSWQPACDWALLIKPLVILAALIGALYISVGAVRND